MANIRSVNRRHKQATARAARSAQPSPVVAKPAAAAETQSAPAALATPVN